MLESSILFQKNINHLVRTKPSEYPILVIIKICVLGLKKYGVEVRLLRYFVRVLQNV